MDQLQITLRKSKPERRYSEAFKKQVVKEFEQGALNKDQLQVKYGIGGNSRILCWCRKYGKLAYPN
jgi:transposase-like protein